jgi:hypothetical protein
MRSAYVAGAEAAGAALHASTSGTKIMRREGLRIFTAELPQLQVVAGAIWGWSSWCVRQLAR